MNLCCNTHCAACLIIRWLISDSMIFFGVYTEDWHVFKIIYNSDNTTFLSEIHSLNLCLCPLNMLHQIVLCTIITTQGCTCQYKEAEQLQGEFSFYLKHKLRECGHCEICYKTFFYHQYCSNKMSKSCSIYFWIRKAWLIVWLSVHVWCNTERKMRQCLFSRVLKRQKQDQTPLSWR